MFEEPPIEAAAESAISGAMKREIVLRVAACVAVLGAAYAVLAMFTQGMLGGVSPQEVWWDRIYAWWVDFLAAGLLLMLAVYLWRRSKRTSASESRPTGAAAWRVVLFPLAHVLLTGCLYFADFGSYLRDQPSESGGTSAATSYFAISAVFVVGAAVSFWFAHRLKKARSEI